MNLSSVVEVEHAKQSETAPIVSEEDVVKKIVINSTNLRTNDYLHRRGVI